MLPLSVTSDWPRSPMEQVTPRPLAPHCVSKASVLLLSLPIAVAMMIHPERLRIRWQLITGRPGTAIATCSVLFRVAAEMSTHIRYALLSHTLFRALLAAISQAGAFATPQHGETVV